MISLGSAVGFSIVSGWSSDGYTNQGWPPGGILDSLNTPVSRSNRCVSTLFGVRGESSTGHLCCVSIRKSITRLVADIFRV